MALESMNLNKITYDQVWEDLIVFEKAHLTKKDHQHDEKKKIVTLKSTDKEKMMPWIKINLYLSPGNLLIITKDLEIREGKK